MKMPPFRTVRDAHLNDLVDHDRDHPGISKRDHYVVSNRITCPVCGQPFGVKGSEPAVRISTGVLVHRSHARRVTA